MSVPEAIRSAIAERPLRRSVRVLMPASRGQVRTVRTSEGDPVPDRMVLVLRVDPGSQRAFADVMLVHSHIELAASSDLVIGPERSTIPYKAVIQTDARGVIWADQLDGLIGLMGPRALKAIGDVAVGDPFYEEGISVGSPLRGPLDPRWDFKGQEGAAIRSLAADCTTALLYDGPPLQLDPGCLALNLIAGREDLNTILYRLLGLVTNYEVAFDLDDVAVLKKVTASDISNWTECFGFLGHDLYRSFSPLMEQALSAIDHSDDVAVDEFVDDLANDRRSEAGVFRKRPGHHVVSASYVSVLDRESSIEHANEHGYQLIDA